VSCIYAAHNSWYERLEIAQPSQPFSSACKLDRVDAAMAESDRSLQSTVWPSAQRRGDGSQWLAAHEPEADDISALPVWRLSSSWVRAIPRACSAWAWPRPTRLPALSALLSSLVNRRAQLVTCHGGSASEVTQRRSGQGHVHPKRVRLRPRRQWQIRIVGARCVFPDPLETSILKPSSSSDAG
jgi:hypothetical protein